MDLLPGGYKVSLYNSEKMRQRPEIGLQIQKGETVNLTLNLDTGKLVRNDK
jgi:hypothetical protein